MLQKTLDSNHLERVLEKDGKDSFLPLTIVTNHHFFDKVDLEYAGQTVDVLYSNDSTSVGPDRSVLSITKLEIEPEVSDLEFQCNTTKVNVALTREGEEWVYRSIEINEYLRE